MHSILERIAAHKYNEVAQAKRTNPLSSLQEKPTDSIRNFVDAVRLNQPAIIAEIKKASPSKGIIRADFDVATIAQTYAAHGASCLSVLTDINFFQGELKFLQVAKANCDLPVLRKDFIIDPYQIHESRVLGADCILLIVAMLDDQQLYDYCQLAHELGMAVLVESHTHDELQRALTLPTPLIGINNRSLHSFDIDIQRSIDLKQYIPADKILICESGIHSHADIKRMQSYDINAFLIGESLMRAPDIGAALQTLIKGTTSRSVL